MAKNVLSERKVAEYVASQLSEDDDHQKTIDELAAYLIETGRTRDVDQTVLAVEEALADRGVVVATITTARPLDDQLRAKITERFTPAGATMYVREKVDPNVIGGFRIELPDGEFDGTIEHKLTTLKGTE